MTKHYVSWDLLKEFPAHAEALHEIERLRGLVAELLPFMVSDATQGRALGPAPVGHADDCDDCLWYESSLKWWKRISQGEFDDFEINIQSVNSD